MQTKLRLHAKMLINALAVSPLIFATTAHAESVTNPIDNLDIYYDDLTHVATKDGNTHLEVEMRLQYRFSTPFESNPKSIDELQADSVSSFGLNRARFKVGGHIYRPWIKLKYEYDLHSSQTLDARITLEHSEEFQFRFGRMKAHYNAERVTSSKDQQFVDRSMVNDYFTLDRQQGISVLGRLNKGTALDLNYSFDIFNGTGREGDNENDKFMYVARVQSNFLGEQISSAMGDLKISQKPAARIAIAGSTNESRYTRFSTSAPGTIDEDTLPEHSEADGYRLEQWLIDAAYRYKGFSFQAEYHSKDITDQYNENFTGTMNLTGYYAQAGFFPHTLMANIPEQLELAARYSTVDPDTSIDGNGQREYLVAANWFLNGHRNKITADIGHYEIDDALTGETESENRIRLQYDISF
jgi:phosphate-selective porin OprO/OprP